MSNCHSEDGRILYPWVLKDVEQLWNEFFSDKFNWRVFTLGKSGSSKKAAFRLSMILRKNARWMDCSSKTDIDQIFEQWRSFMIGASGYLQKHGVEEASEALNRPLQITMTFWRFQEPSLKHLHDMTHLAMGNEPDQALQADFERRKNKAELLKEFGQDCKEYARRFAYLSGSGEHSNQKLEAALNICRAHIGQALDDLQWEDQ